MTPLFAQGAFQIDPNASPEQIKRKRQLIADLMPQYGKASYVGEGVGQLLYGIGAGIQNRKLNKAESAGQAGATDLFSRIVGGANAAPGGFSMLGQAPQQAPNPNSPQQIGNDTMAALGKMPDGLDAFNASLARTESGGNYNAANSEGYQGKYQFGVDRLNDYNRATGQNVDMATFRANPALQEKVQAWHVGDIDANLGSLYGTQVGGMQMTPNAVRAMAHLGGIGGARKFIESGGAYDPADSNGTNLSDYARTHGGGGQTTMSAQNAPMQPMGGGQDMGPLYEALGNPWLSEQQRGVITSMIAQQQGAPMQALEMQNAQLGLQKSQLELAQMQNPQADPMAAIELQMAQIELDNARNPPAPKPYSDIGQIQADMNAGLITPEQAETAVGKLGSGVTVNNTVSPNGEPNDAPLRKKLMEGEGTTWNNYLTAGTTSSGMRQDMELLDQVIEMAPQGPISGRLAQAFPGVSDAAGVFQSVVKRVAPSLRVEGSGAQSDIEYNGFLQSLPSLTNRPEANRAISTFLKSKAQINMDRGQAIQEYQNGAIDAPEARRRIAEIDGRSIMTPELQGLLGGMNDGSMPSSDAVPDGVDPEDWQYMSEEERALFR